MAQWIRSITLGVGGALLTVFGVTALGGRIFASSQTHSQIVDFHPTRFQAQTEAKFFYSIGDDLKSSDHIDPQANTLLHGHIENFLVSPDRMKIVVVIQGSLVLVDEQWLSRKVASVDSIYRKRIGRRFFRDDNFQWTKDSKGFA